ncbi:MAG: PAS domain S-box protein [Gammaproteobacteria bacterium]|nr:PAS domain S-box protein [Gammaproteobacteria bacterium]
MKYSIKKLWYSYVVIVVLLPPLIIMPWFLVNEYDLSLASSLQKQSSVNAELEKQISLNASHMIELLKNKSDAIALQLSDKNDNKFIYELLEIIINREKFIHGLLVVSAQGQVESAIDRDKSNIIKMGAPENLIDNQWLSAHWGLRWKEAVRSPEFVLPNISEIYISDVVEHEGLNIFRVSIPLSYKKLIQGYLIAEIDVDEFLKNWNKLATARDGVSYLVNSNGRLLSRVDGGVYKTGDLISSKAEIRKIISANEQTDKAALEGISGELVYAVSRVVSTVNWTVVSEINRQSLLRPIQLKTYKAVAVVILLMVIFIVLGIKILNLLIRPIENVSSAVHVFSLGEALVKKIPPSSVSELNTLIDGFNNIVAENLKIDDVLQKSKDRLLLHRDQSPLAVIEWNTNFEFLDWNPAAEKIFGFSKKEVLGKHITETILPESAREAVDEVWRLLMADQGGLHSINENTTKDGRTIICEWTNTPLKDEAGNVVGVNSFVDDVTEKLQQQEQLRQQEKMTALDKLSGGISHDFNNLLNAIMGYADLIVTNTESDIIKKYASVIMTAGERGTKLTKQLLRFSSKEAHQVSIVDINSLISEEAPILEKSLTARIKLELNIVKELWPVCIDGADLQDAVLNICINAMHAIQANGIVSIATSNVTLDQTRANSMNMEAADYVILSISDSGCGMNEETLAHIFDPFFTTKGELGTGLGLSQVYGFVKRAGGTIVAKSEINKGSEFIIYLPRYIESDNALQQSILADSEKTVVTEKRLGGNESILVVDDEEGLRSLCVELLEAKGYRVAVAGDGVEALAVMEQSRFDLVLSDVVMPNMDGYTLAAAIQKRWPETKIQLVSGFTDGLQSNREDETLHRDLIYKPYELNAILSRIRKLLDQ